jgi:transcriptional regulator NrdR family protein
MKCTNCRGVSLPVVETRKAPAGVYRRRKCRRCDADLVTLEQAVNESIRPHRNRNDTRHKPA